MNWTGGRLSRHSGTSNPVKDRQKQHFARVQQALRTGPTKNSLMKWSFFDQFAEYRQRSQRKSSAAQYRSLRVYSNQESQSSQQHHGHPSSDQHLAQKNSARRSPRSQEPSQSRQTSVSVKKQLSEVPIDNLYNATPPPRKTKRKRKDSIPRSEMKSLAGRVDTGESVLEKRRKILQKGDWVGVNIQRPLQLAFASPMEEANIGRRRRLTDGHRARYNSKQIHITSPFPSQSRLLANHGPNQEGPQRREPARTDVRISIGGRVVPPGISSSSAPRRMGSHSTSARRRSQTTLSDVMLLDAEASITQGSPQMTTSNLAASKYLASVPQINSHSQAPRPMKTSLADEVEQGDHKSYEANEIGDGWAAVFSDSASELNDNVQEPVNNRHMFKAYLERHKRRLSAPNNDYNKDDHHGRLIFSSSSTSIHHPAPRSSKVSVLLRSASSEITESTAAQVGKVKPTVPSSQILENEIWVTWIAPEQNFDRSSDHDYFNENRNIQQFSISPGISTGPTTWHVNKIRGEREDEYLLELEGPYSDEPESCSEISNMTTIALSNGIVTGSSGLAQRETGTVEKELKEIGRGASLVDKEPPKTPVSTVFPDKDITEEDQNESWTKFLFGGDSDEVDARIPTPKRNAVPSQSGEFSSTSILGQASSDEAALSEVNATLQDANTPAAPSTISGATSKVAEVSPCPTGSKYSQPNAEMTSTLDYPSWKGGISVQAERGSFLASSSDYASASVAVQAMSQQSASDVVETASLYRPQGKVMFTKPKPFIGRKANVDSASDRRSLHMGRILVKDDKKIESRRKRERGMRRLFKSDEQDEHEEVESIDDD
jgi:hypothetical protein